MPSLRIIAYDVVCDNRRNRLAAVACSVATRIQDSVYEGILTDRQLTAFLQRAEPLLDPAADSLRVYTVCLRCRTKIVYRDHLARRETREDNVV